MVGWTAVSLVVVSRMANIRSVSPRMPSTSTPLTSPTTTTAASTQPKARAARRPIQRANVCATHRKSLRTPRPAATRTTNTPRPRRAAAPSGEAPRARRPSSHEVNSASALPGSSRRAASPRPRSGTPAMTTPAGLRGGRSANSRHTNAPVTPRPYPIAALIPQTNPWNTPGRGSSDGVKARHAKITATQAPGQAVLEPQPYVPLPAGSTGSAGSARAEVSTHRRAVGRRTQVFPLGRPPGYLGRDRWRHHVVVPLVRCARLPEHPRAFRVLSHPTSFTNIVPSPLTDQCASIGASRLSLRVRSSQNNTPAQAVNTYGAQRSKHQATGPGAHQLISGVIGRTAGQ